MHVSSSQARHNLSLLHLLKRYLELCTRFATWSKEYSSINTRTCCSNYLHEHQCPLLVPHPSTTPPISPSYCSSPPVGTAAPRRYMARPPGTSSRSKSPGQRLGYRLGRMDLLPTTTYSAWGGERTIAPGPSAPPLTSTADMFWTLGTGNCALNSSSSERLYCHKTFLLCIKFTS